MNKFFPNLFSPIKIGNVELRNRVVHSPHGTESEDTDCFVPERSIGYYVERARGGIGLLLYGDINIEGQSASVSLASSVFVPRMRDLTDEVHFWGAKIFAHLTHSASDPIYQVWKIEAGEQVDAIATVSGESPELGAKARPLTIAEIEHLEDRYADAAQRAKLAGFDGVSINSAYGFLPAQFLSSKANKRTDKYGGDLIGRTRFLSEIIRKIRTKTDRSFPVIVKVSGDELRDGGLTLEETVAAAPVLEEAGLSAMFVVGGTQTMRDIQRALPPMCTMPLGCFIPFAEGVRKVVRIPVIVGTRINDPQMAEETIRGSKADLIAMSRASLADPEWARKAKQGRVEDIRKCLYCNECLRSFWPKYIHHVKCAINAAANREREYRIRPAEKRKKVLIAGAGPAGMEAARIAAMRGHDVTLCEKGGQLGGQLLIAAKAPHKEELNNLTLYLTTQLRKLPIKVKLNQEVTPDLVKKIIPDVVIVATGAVPLIPDIPGIRGSNVVKAWDIFARDLDVGKSVVVGGGGMVGCQVAERFFLAGKNVTIIEILDDIAMDVEWTTRVFMLERFAKYDMTILTGTKVEEILPSGVLATDKQGEKKEIRADSVVLAMGSHANNSMALALENIMEEVYAIGDCQQPRHILEAVHDGAYIARII